MADQTQRLEIATVKAEVGSNILYLFSNAAENALPISTESGEIRNLKQIIAAIREEGAEKISFATTIFPSVASGLAVAPDGGVFLVQSSEADEIYAVWRNEAGAAVSTGKTAMSSQAVQDALAASNEAAHAAEDAADRAIDRTAPLLDPSNGAPVTRDDGMPLQVGDTYFNTADQLEYIYKKNGWVAREQQDIGNLPIATQLGDYDYLPVLQEGSTKRVPGSVLARRTEIAEISLVSYGGKPGADCSAAIISAISDAGRVAIPYGNYIATPAADQVPALLAALKRVSTYGSLDVMLPAGSFDLHEQVILGGTRCANTSLLGAPIVISSIAALIGVTGSAKNWGVVISLSSTAGMAVGDYLFIRPDASGTGDFYAHAGAWRILAISGNQVTLRNTHQATVFPTSTLTSGSVVCFKTMLNFHGCDGLRAISGETFGLLDRLAVIGDYDLATGTGTVGCHGLVIASPNVVDGANSNASFDTGGNARLGTTGMAFCNWGEQGVACSMRSSLVCNYVAFSSNRKRGLYSEGAHIRSKLSVASGNGEDGFISDTSGMIQAALCWASGNGLNGFWSTNLSLLNASRCIATGNAIHGFESRGQTRLNAELALSMGNGQRGYSATYGGMIYAPSSAAQGNGAEGYYALGGGAEIQALNGTSTGNLSFGARAQQGGYITVAGTGSVSGNTASDYSSEIDSIIINVAGAVVAGSSARKSDLTVVSPSTSAGLRVANSSIGDATLSMDGSGAGAFTARWVFKSDGVLHPSGDNTQDLARAANRFKNMYAGTGTIQTSDERLKTEIAEISDIVLDAWQGVEFCQYRFKDAVSEKGDSARLHIGVIAQVVRSAFEDAGIDPFAFGLLCHDYWVDSPEVLDSEGHVLEHERSAGDRYSVRYEEALALEAALMRREAGRLRKRVELLEATIRKED